MSARLAVVLPSVALVVAVLGATPLGHASRLSPSSRASTSSSAGPACKGRRRSFGARSIRATPTSDTVETTLTSGEIEAVNHDTTSLAAATTVTYVCTAFGAGATAYGVFVTAIKV